MPRRKTYIVSYVFLRYNICTGNSYILFFHIPNTSFYAKRSCHHIRRPEVFCAKYVIMDQSIAYNYIVWRNSLYGSPTWLPVNSNAYGMMYIHEYNYIFPSTYLNKILDDELKILINEKRLQKIIAFRYKVMLNETICFMNQVQNSSKLVERLDNLVWNTYWWK